MNANPLLKAVERSFQRREKERRTESDRRTVKSPGDVDNRRKEKRRMSSSDRRGLQHGVYYKTDEPLAYLYFYLRDYCEGAWSVGLEHVDSNHFRRTVKVHFELESDKNRFLDTIVRR